MGDGVRHGQPLLVVVVLLWIVVPASVVAQCPCNTSANVAALMELYDATNGAGWVNNTGWSRSPSTALCEWYGPLGCNGGEVSSISLVNNRLAGTLPAAMGAKITALRYLHLDTNNISGTLPPEWANLTGLVDIYLNTNRLSGTLPPEWSHLSTLQGLHLDSNSINGTLPPE